MNQPPSRENPTTFNRKKEKRLSMSYTMLYGHRTHKLSLSSSAQLESGESKKESCGHALMCVCVSFRLFICMSITNSWHRFHFRNALTLALHKIINKTKNPSKVRTDQDRRYDESHFTFNIDMTLSRLNEEFHKTFSVPIVLFGVGFAKSFDGHKRSARWSYHDLCRIGT